jgi:hypothetical protein
MRFLNKPNRFSAFTWLLDQPIAHRGTVPRGSLRIIARNRSYFGDSTRSGISTCSSAPPKISRSSRSQSLRRPHLRHHQHQPLQARLAPVRIAVAWWRLKPGDRPRLRGRGEDAAAAGRRLELGEKRRASACSGRNWSALELRDRLVEAALGAGTMAD